MANKQYLVLKPFVLMDPVGMVDPMFVPKFSADEEDPTVRILLEGGYIREIGECFIGRSVNVYPTGDWAVPPEIYENGNQK